MKKSILRVIAGMLMLLILLSSCGPAVDPNTNSSTDGSATTDEYNTNDSVVDIPATDDPATDDPATDDPATDNPATDAPATDAPETSDIYIERPDKEIKNILMIGNSFCYYFVEELYGIAKEAGYELNVANLYESGCPVSDHWKWLQNETESYEFYITNKNGRVKTPVKTINGALSYAKDTWGVEWDVITFQQHFYPEIASDYTKAYSSAKLYAKMLFNYVKNNHKDALTFWHQTWAYQVGYGVGKNPANDQIPTLELQTKTYENIRDASKAIAKENGVNLIPSGDAWQIARADARVGDVMCARKGINGGLGDNYHDGDIGGGQYLNACVWFEVLMGESCIGNTWRPSDYNLSEEKIVALQEAAHEAVGAIYGPGYAK